MSDVIALAVDSYWYSTPGKNKYGKNSLTTAEKKTLIFSQN